MPRTAPFRPASDRTIGFLTTLMDERQLDEEGRATLAIAITDGTLSQSVASNFIDLLKRAPRKEQPDAITEPDGMYEFDGMVFIIKRSRQTGNLYAKSFDLETRRYEYAAGAMRYLRKSHRISLERAIELSDHIGACIRCNRTLTNPDSVSRQLGPICVQYFA